MSDSDHSSNGHDAPNRNPKADTGSDPPADSSNTSTSLSTYCSPKCCTNGTPCGPATCEPPALAGDAVGVRGETSNLTTLPSGGVRHPTTVGQVGQPERPDGATYLLKPHGDQPELLRIANAARRFVSASYSSSQCSKMPCACSQPSGQYLLGLHQNWLI
jgi:hypothetical protein